MDARESVLGTTDQDWSLAAGTQCFVAMEEPAIQADQNGCPSVGIFSRLLVAAENIALPLKRHLLDGELRLSLLPRNNERHRRPVILNRLIADLLGGALAHTENGLDARLLQRCDRCRADHAAIGDHADLSDAEARASVRTRA
jgi:hypothetical protein